MKTMALPEVDEAKITIIMDNSIDVLMAGTEVAKRMPLGSNPFERTTPRAEHGFSVLINVRQSAKHGVVLFDTGVSRTGILNNFDALDIKPTDIQAIVLSH